MVMGSSATTRHSMAWPEKTDILLTPGQGLARCRADAGLDHVYAVIISVTGCSTWTRVFISIK